MARHLLALVEDDPDRLAVADETGTWTRAEHNARANRLIAGLRALGLRPGDTVALLAYNRHEWLEVVTATTAASWVVVPVNWHLAADEVAYMLADSGAVAVVVDAELADLATQALASVPTVRVKVLLGGPPVPGFVDYEELLADQSPEEPPDQATGATMFYTSGTTGRPKGVRHAGFALGLPMSEAAARAPKLADLFHVPPGGLALVNSPLYHSGPYALSTIPMGVGAGVLLRRRFDPAESLELIDEWGVTTAYFVPTHFVRMLRLPEDVRARFRGESLRYVLHTAAPCPPEVKRRMIEWWGPVVNEVYGATETAGMGVFVTAEEWLDAPGTVGRPFPTCEVVIVDDDGRELDVGEVGTICFRSLAGHDFAYHGDEEKTAGAHVFPGLVTVGDVGYLDEKGRLFLADRKIDMVISGGVNVYPAEIEAVLLEHPAVADVAVFGVPDAEFGEQVKAVISPAVGHEAGEVLAEELAAFARTRLAGYKVPRSFDFLDELPRTPTGKLLKRELREPYWAATGRSI